MELIHLPIVSTFVNLSLALEVSPISFTDLFPANGHELHHFFEAQMRLVLHELSLALFDIDQVSMEPLLRSTLGWVPWLLNCLPVSDGWRQSNWSYLLNIITIDLNFILCLSVIDLLSIMLHQTISSRFAILGYIYHISILIYVCSLLLLLQNLSPFSCQDLSQLVLITCQFWLAHH